MAELVRAVIGDQELNVGRAYAEKKRLKVLDEPTHRPDGRPRPATRRGGRPDKPKTTVDEAAAKKRGTSKAAKKTSSSKKSRSTKTTAATAAAAKKAENSADTANPPSKE